MKPILSAIALMLFVAPFSSGAQQNGGSPPISKEIQDDRDADMLYRVQCFEQLVNDHLSGKSPMEQLDPFLMNRSDVDFWMEQFVFTEEVLTQISKDGFYNRLEGWAETARVSFTAALRGVESFEVINHKFSYGADPALKVSQSANLAVYLKVGEDITSSLYLTLIDIQGQLKLIQVNEQ